MAFAGDGTGVFAEIEDRLGADTVIVRSPQEVEDVFDAADIDVSGGLEDGVLAALVETGWLTDDYVGTWVAVEAVTGAAARGESTARETAQQAPEPVVVSEGPHTLVGVGPRATWPEVMAAYRRRARDLHPDRLAADASPTERAAAERAMAELNAALEDLRSRLQGQPL